MRQNKRRVFTGIFALATVPLITASVAYACQTLATLHANPTSGAAGETVRLTGANYSTANGASNIEIRLDSRSAPPIMSIAPTSRNIDVDLKIPDNTAIGHHTIIATQNGPSGAPVAGTPGRASFQVTSAGSATAASNETAPGPASSDPAPASGAPAASPSEPARTDPAPQPTPAPPASASEPVAPGSAEAAGTGDASPGGGSSPTPSAASSLPGAPPAAAVVEPSSTAMAGDVPVATEAAPVVAEHAPVAPAAARVGLVPVASGERPSMLPGLALASGLALVLLGLGAFWRSDRSTLFGGGNLRPIG